MKKKIINQESSLESSLCTSIFKQLIAKDLVALTGIECACRRTCPVQFGPSGSK